MPGPMELVLIFLVILLLFGAKRIPEILKSFGEGIKEFKKGMSNLTDTDSDQKDKKNQGNSNQSNSQNQSNSSQNNK